MKTDIEDEPLGLDFVNGLRPRRYRWKERQTELVDEVLTTDPGVRYHHGLIAQEVKTLLDSCNVNTSDFAGYVYDKPTDSYGLNLGEFMGILIKSVQELSLRVSQLEKIDKKRT